MSMFHRVILIASFCVLWTGCDLFDSGSSRELIPKPDRLNPQNDLFSQESLRSFVWKEGWKNGSRDTTLTPRTFKIQNNGAIPANGDSIRSVVFQAVDGYSLPGNLATNLGLNPTKLSFDTVTLSDPGPALTYPDSPYVGWRTELTSGDLRFVRELKGTATVPWGSAYNVETWMFADTSYWNGTVTATYTYYLGRYGLVKMRLEQPGFNSDNDTTTKILWRELTAQ
jgi:hypothetical protein